MGTLALHGDPSRALVGVVTFVVCGVLGAIFLWAGSDNLRRTWRLDEEGIVADARVTNWAVATETTEVYESDTPEIQYVLEVGGVAYHRSSASQSRAGSSCASVSVPSALRSVGRRGRRR